MDSLQYHTEQEKSGYDKRALIIAIIAFVLLAILAYFIKVWTAPPPPWPESSIGMTVDFGTALAGSGTNNDSENTAEATETTETQTSESTQSEATETTSETTSESTSTTEAVETATETQGSEATVTTESASSSQSSGNMFTESLESGGVPSGEGNDNQAGNAGQQDGTESDNKEGFGGLGDVGVGGGWDFATKPEFSDVPFQGKVILKFLVDKNGIVEIKEIASNYDRLTEEKIKVFYEKELQLRRINNEPPPAYAKGKFTIILKP